MAALAFGKVLNVKRGAGFNLIEQILKVEHVSGRQSLFSVFGAFKSLAYLVGDDGKLMQTFEEGQMGCGRVGRKFGERYCIEEEDAWCSIVAQRYECVLPQYRMPASPVLALIRCVNLLKISHQMLVLIDNALFLFSSLTV